MYVTWTALFMVAIYYLQAKNDKNEVTQRENAVKHDKKAPLHRKNGPAPDEEAYATDKKAYKQRNIEPVPDKDAPQHRKD